MVADLQVVLTIPVALVEKRGLQESHGGLTQVSLLVSIVQGEAVQEEVPEISKGHKITRQDHCHERQQKDNKVRGVVRVTLNRQRLFRTWQCGKAMHNLIPSRLLPGQKIESLG